MRGRRSQIDHAHGRVCIDCGDFKPRDEMRLLAYVSPKTGIKHMDTRCKVCYAAYQRNLYSGDLRRRALQIAHSHNVSKRVKQGGLGYVDPQYVADLLLGCAACPSCGKPRGADELFHLDHIQPLSRGGRHEESNLQAICEFCNMAKQEKDITKLQEWITGIRERALADACADFPPIFREVFARHGSHLLRG